MIYVDADACPVKAEIYRVADRHAVEVFVVSNRWIAVPRDPRLHLVLVDAAADAADDWIAARADARDVVVTADIPLAARCVRAGAAVIAPDGRLLTEDSIGLALATRNLMTDLRAAGHQTRGPRPLAAADRSRFLSALHEAVSRRRRAGTS